MSNNNTTESQIVSVSAILAQLQLFLYSMGMAECCVWIHDIDHDHEASKNFA